MWINYGKSLCYVLFFFACVHTGYSFGILASLRDAVVAAESVFGDVLQNVMKFASNFKNLHDIFDAAVEEHCVFKCPVKEVIPKPNRNHQPKADGCGSLGLNIKSDYLPVREMTKCCDAHDICYDTCNNIKEDCDTEFKHCLYRYCDTYKKSVGDTIVKGCKGAAKLLFTGTLTLGCKSYQDAQRKACYCPPLGWKDSSNYKYTRGDGEL